MDGAIRLIILFLFCIMSFACTTKKYVLNPDIKDIEVVTWEDKSSFKMLEDSLLISNYHPEIKLLFSSPLDLIKLSQDGMNIWAKAYINTLNKKVSLICSEIYLEKVMINNEYRNPDKLNYPLNFYSISTPSRTITSYLYSVFIIIKYPDIFRKQIKSTNNILESYNLMDTNSDIFLSIEGVVPFTHTILTSQEIHIPNNKIKTAISRVLPLKIP